MEHQSEIRVCLDPQQAKFLASCLASKRYQTASDVVSEGLRLLEREHTKHRAEADRVREMIRVGAEQLERGEVVDGEIFFREWDAELAELEGQNPRKSE